MPAAAELRTRFHEVPKETRDANQSFAIRVWRGLSWLERAEGYEAGDFEGRFISCWIGLNALYGRQDDPHHPWGDREALGTFLAQTNQRCQVDFWGGRIKEGRKGSVQ